MYYAHIYYIVVYIVMLRAPIDNKLIFASDGYPERYKLIKVYLSNNNNNNNNNNNACLFQPIAVLLLNCRKVQLITIINN